MSPVRPNPLNGQIVPLRRRSDVPRAQRAEIRMLLSANRQAAAARRVHHRHTRPPTQAEQEHVRVLRRWHLFLLNALWDLPGLSASEEAILCELHDREQESAELWWTLLQIWPHLLAQAPANTIAPLPARARRTTKEV